jgi:hypothetical protein
MSSAEAAAESGGTARIFLGRFMNPKKINPAIKVHRIRSMNYTSRDWSDIIESLDLYTVVCSPSCEKDSSQILVWVWEATG